MTAFAGFGIDPSLLTGQLAGVGNLRQELMSGNSLALQQTSDLTAPADQSWNQPSSWTQAQEKPMRITQDQLQVIVPGGSAVPGQQLMVQRFRMDVRCKSWCQLVQL
jgi:hypothetical protein